MLLFVVLEQEMNEKFKVASLFRASPSLSSLSRLGTLPLQSRPSKRTNFQH
jgi:hypothetical protein